MRPARPAGASLLLAALTVLPAWVGAAPEPGPDAPAVAARVVDFQAARPSPAAREKAGWAVRTGDNENLPFIVVDKQDARVFVFSPSGALVGDAPALLGLAIGDTAVPGIGQRKLSSIRPEERTTPAGRFVAELDRNLSGDVILWVDYDGAVSLHPLRSSHPGEHRAARLASSTPADNRISYGCINVSQAFFSKVVVPTFAEVPGIVYILPEDASGHAPQPSQDHAR